VAYTEADLSLIRAARLRGTRTVQFADRSVTYQSDQEMRQVEQDILASLASVSITRRAKQTLGVSSKGF
jgi:hypothetical protein